MAMHISLTGEAEEQIRAIQKAQGGTIPQNIRQAIKAYFDRLFPNGAPAPKPS
jgi:hypothetical protein